MTEENYITEIAMLQSQLELALKEISHWKEKYQEAYMNPRILTYDLYCTTCGAQPAFTDNSLCKKCDDEKEENPTSCNTTKP